MKRLIYLLFPLNYLLAITLTTSLTLLTGGYGNGTDPYGLSGLFIFIFIGVILLLLLLAFLLRKFLNPLPAFLIEAIIVVVAVAVFIPDVESVHFQNIPSGVDEFVLIYDEQYDDRLNWSFKENDIDLLSLSPTITNRKYISVDEQIEYTKREPVIYLPTTAFTDELGNELKFHRSRVDTFIDHEYRLLFDYFSREYLVGRDTLVQNSPLVRKAKAMLFPQNK